MDNELVLEERLGKMRAEKGDLVQEKKDLQRELKEVHDRLDRLQVNNVSVIVTPLHVQRPSADVSYSEIYRSD